MPHRILPVDDIVSIYLLDFQRYREQQDVPKDITQKGIAFSETGKAAEAMSSYMMSLALCERTGDLKTASQIYSNIVDVHLQSGNSAEARPYYLRSLETAEDIGFRWQMAVCYRALTKIDGPDSEYAKMLSELNEE